MASTHPNEHNMGDNASIKRSKIWATKHPPKASTSITTVTTKHPPEDSGDGQIKTKLGAKEKILVER
jgi:hypothetical protein